nr:MAG TPA_asm: cobalamin biosynthetic cobalt chelatase [Bacteriophage sp.]
MGIIPTIDEACNRLVVIVPTFFYLTVNTSAGGDG